MTLEERNLTEILKRLREDEEPLTPKLCEQYGRRPVEHLKLFMKHLYDMHRIEIRTIPRSCAGNWYTSTTYHAGPELVPRLNELQRRRVEGAVS